MQSQSIRPVLAEFFKDDREGEGTQRHHPDGRASSEQIHAPTPVQASEVDATARPGLLHGVLGVLSMHEYVIVAVIILLAVVLVVGLELKEWSHHFSEED